MRCQLASETRQPNREKPTESHTNIFSLHPPKTTALHPLFSNPTASIFLPRSNLLTFTPTK